MAEPEARGGLRRGVQLVEGDNERVGSDAGAVGSVDVPDSSETGKGWMGRECGRVVEMINGSDSAMWRKEAGTFPSGG